jgi:alpha-L-fucosidase
VALTYTGKGRIVWGIDIEGGEHIQNEQNASHNYQKFPMGWMKFPKAGTYTIRVLCLEGDLKEASLKAIQFTPVINNLEQ